MECGGTGKNRWWSPTLPTASLLIGLARWWVSLNLIQVQRFLTKVSSDRLMSHLMITGHCQSLS